MGWGWGWGGWVCVCVTRIHQTTRDVLTRITPFKYSGSNQRGVVCPARSYGARACCTVRTKDVYPGTPSSTSRLLASMIAGSWSNSANGADNRSGRVMRRTIGVAAEWPGSRSYTALPSVRSGKRSGERERGVCELTRQYSRTILSVRAARLPDSTGSRCGATRF